MRNVILMDLNNLLKEKKEKNSTLKTKFSLPAKNKAIGLIKVSNKTLIKELRDGLINLPASFIIEINGINTEKLGSNIVATGKIDSKDLMGFDFLIASDDLKNINKYFALGITPIISKENTLNGILKEFNPLKNEGNSYIYTNEDKWSVYYALIRYLENYKFQFDNKNLVKNVLDI